MRIRTALGAVLVGALVSACAAAPDAPTRDTLTIATANTADCLDPAQNLTANSSPFVRPLVDSLVYQNPEDGSLHPWLATSWTVDPTATAFTFVLRDDVTFSDGARLDAAAVKTTWDAVVALGAQAATANSLLSGYAGTTVTAPDTLVVRFDSPKSSFVQAASTTALAPLSPASWQRGAPERCAGNYAGAGPFTLGSVQGKERLSLVRRDDYHWGPAPWRPGPAALARLDFELVAEPGVQLDALNSSTVDTATGIAKRQVGVLAADRFATTRIPSPGIAYTITPNTSRGPLTDEAVRRALIAATDRTQLVDVALGGGAAPATGVLSANTPGYQALGDELAVDRARATALLDGAGWRPGPDGIRVKDGQRLSLAVTYPAVDQVDQPLLELLQQQWAQVGVELTLRGLPVAELSPTQDRGDYDLLVFNQVRGDPDVLRTVFAASGKNRARLAADDPLNAALDQQAAQADPDQRARTVADIQRALIARGLTDPLYEPTAVVASAAGLDGYPLDGSFHDTRWAS